MALPPGYFGPSGPAQEFAGMSVAHATANALALTRVVETKVEQQQRAFYQYQALQALRRGVAYRRTRKP